MIAALLLSGGVAYKALRLAEFCLGLLLLCIALFLYEDEHGKIQSTLDTWWIHLKDAQDTALSRQAAFMRGVAKLTTEVFDKLFGNRLISLRAVGTSLSLGTGSYMIIYGLLFREFFHFSPWFPGLGVLFIGLGLAPLIFTRSKVLYIWFGVVLLAVTMLLTASVEIESHGAREVSMDVLLLAGSLTCDIVFVWMTRRMLKWVTHKSSFTPMLGIILLNLCAAALLVEGPWIAFGRLSSDYAELQLLSFTNAFDALVSFVFVLFAILMLLHVIFWPLLNRLVYALAEAGIAKRRRLNAAIGLALLAASTGRSLELLKKIADIFS
jgi:hypothetical protein